MTLGSRILGKSAAIAAIRTQVERLLRRHAEGARRLPPILILGETGTGKGLLAGAIHQTGPRAAGPFVDVNCAAIPEALLEAELFGFERGAFTDARQAKPGLFQAAHRGTLFLDEVGLLPEGLQSKLLKALEERTVRRLGSTRREPVDAWLIAATSEDLVAAVGARRFREDLYHRLAVVTLELPPLRARGGDVLILAEHFLERACADYGLAPKTLSPDARAALLAHAWPGNVRELGNVMERVALMADGISVGAAMLDLRAPIGRGAASSAVDQRRKTIAAEAESERERLLEALRATRWNLSRAAARLGIPRNTLRYRMEKLGLAPGAGPPGGRMAPAEAPAGPPAPVERSQAAPGDPTAPAEPAASPDVVVPRPPASAPASAVRWEPRRIALLRIRLVPSGEGTDVSEISRAMAVAFDKARSFGGQVDEVSASGLLAAFGLGPVEDAPRHAAYAALAIQKVLARARQEGSARVAVALALHASRLPVARFGESVEIDAEARRPAWAVLDALAAQGPPDTVVVTPSTVPFLARRFEIVPLGPAPAEAYRLAGPADVGRGPGRFVGRDAELKLLRERLAQARGGHGQIVSVVGEPGIGKSRLLRELRLDVADQAAWMEGQALASGRTMPFHPLIDLLRRAFHVEESDPEAVVIEKMEQAVLGLGEDLRRALPYLRYLLSVDQGDPAVSDMDPHLRRAEIFDALRALLVRTAESRPLVVAFEDLHWMDQATREWLALLAESLAARRILLVLTHRPGHAPPFSDRSFHTRLALTALSTADSLAVARALLGADELPDALQALIVRKAAGNPFFVEELVMSLEEAGALGREGDRLVLAGSLEDLAVPGTIQDVILARIDRLEPAAREVLQVAATIGKDVPLALLEPVVDRGEGALGPDLRRLQAADLLSETSFFPDVVYTFKHALTHEVAYASLPPDRRHALHARIVAVLERLAADRPDEHVDRLAYHAFRGQVWAKAVRYLRRAGARAFARSANREAVGCFEQALDALRHLPEMPDTLREGVDIRFELRNALFPLTELERIRECLDEAERLARRLDDRRRLGWVAAYQSSHLWMVGRAGEMLGVAHTLKDTAEALEDFALQIAANAYLGAACLATGDYRSGEALLRKNVRSLDADLRGQSFGLTVLPAVNARARLAWCLAERGEFAEGISLGEDGVRMAEALDHPFSLVTACTLVGYLYRVKGDWSRARHLLERGLALSQEWSVTLWSPPLIGSLGAVYAESGEAARGLALIRDALARYDATGLGFFQSLVLVQLGEACVRARLMREALGCAERALAQSRERGERGYEAWALRLLGEVATHADVPDGGSAESHYRRAMALADELGMRPLLAHCSLGLGRLYERAGLLPKAVEHLTTAAGLYRDMGMDVWLAEADAALRGTLSAG
jgi:transcriptional regulator with AAA-type ATPase domain/tetratricopeptide (TPR) repeat protein